MSHSFPTRRSSDLVVMAVAVASAAVETVAVAAVTAAAVEIVAAAVTAVVVMAAVVVIAVETVMAAAKDINNQLSIDTYFLVWLRSNKDFFCPKVMIDIDFTRHLYVF